MRLIDYLLAPFLDDLFRVHGVHGLRADRAWTGVGVLRARSARCEPGLLAYIAGYLGIVEPQMRMTEHLHMMIQILGLSHPRQFFRSGHFVDLFRRVWSYFASICFTSQEAFATSFGSTDAVATLRNAPLMPVKPKQREHLGVARAEECAASQQEARGGPPDSDPRSKPFTAWTPCGYQDLMPYNMSSLTRRSSVALRALLSVVYSYV